jgi:hypothetical protein
MVSGIWKGFVILLAFTRLQWRNSYVNRAACFVWAVIGTYGTACMHGRTRRTNHGAHLEESIQVRRQIRSNDMQNAYMSSPKAGESGDTGEKKVILI